MGPSLFDTQTSLLPLPALVTFAWVLEATTIFVQEHWFVS